MGRRGRFQDLFSLLPSRLKASFWCWARRLGTECRKRRSQRPHSAGTKQTTTTGDSHYLHCKQQPGEACGEFLRMPYAGSPLSENTPSETVRKVLVGLNLRLCESAKRGKAYLSPSLSRPSNVPLILRSTYSSDSFSRHLSE